MNFKDIRTTATQTKIIDITDENTFQTCWLKLLYPVEYDITVDNDNIIDILDCMDTQIRDQLSKLGSVHDHYRPLSQSNYFKLRLSTNTVLFDRHRTSFEKAEIGKILKPGQLIRFIFRLKKISYKEPDDLYTTIDLLQIEMA